MKVWSFSERSWSFQGGYLLSTSIRGKFTNTLNLHPKDNQVNLTVRFYDSNRLKKEFD